MRKWLALSSVIVVLDQISKVAAGAWLAPGAPVAVMPFVNLTLVYNPGAAFSLFSDAGGWQRWVLLAITAAVCAFLYHWLKGLGRGETGSAIAIAAVIGGALGNAIDRLLYGHVVDFIDVYYAVHHWPVFNIADTAITLGAVGLFVASVRSG